MEFYVRLGAYIRKCREEKGIKQKELAAKIGINDSSMSNIECGKNKIDIYIDNY